MTLLGSLAVIVAGWATWRGGLGWARLRRRRHAAGALVVALVATGYAGWTGGGYPWHDESPAAAVTARPATALAVLATLAVKGRAPKTGYDRDAVRARVGRHEPQRLRHPQRHPQPGPGRQVVKAGTGSCKVLEGTAAPEVYTGATVRFVLGGASDIDIDHVVALGDAWQKGAQQWAALDAGRVRQRPVEPARGRRGGEPGEGRR